MNVLFTSLVILIFFLTQQCTPVITTCMCMRDQLDGKVIEGVDVKLNMDDPTKRGPTLTKGTNDCIYITLSMSGDSDINFDLIIEAKGYERKVLRGDELLKLRGSLRWKVNIYLQRSEESK